MNTKNNLQRWQPCRGYCQMNGAASAILSIRDAKVVMNCPRWCAVLAERELAIAVKEFETRLYCSEVLETDLLFGVGDKLVEAVEEACADGRNSLLAVLTNCSMSLIGDDIKGVCSELQTECPVVAIDSGGLTGEYWEGWSNALITILKNMHLQEIEPSRGTVNLIGCSACYPQWQGDVRELRRMLGLVGIEVNVCLIENGTTLKQLEQLGRGQLNIVINEEIGLPVAQWLEENLHQPYLNIPMPYGLEGSLAWLSRVAQALQINIDLNVIQEEIKWAKEMIFREYSVLKGACDNLFFQRLVISSYYGKISSLLPALEREWPVFGKLYYRINGPRGEEKLVGSEWSYTNPLEKLEEDAYQIVLGSERDLHELCGFKNTAFLEFMMPASRISVPWETYLGITGWLYFSKQLIQQILHLYKMNNGPESK